MEYCIGIMEKSWKNHGILFSKSCGNPEMVQLYDGPGHSKLERLVLPAGMMDPHSKPGCPGSKNSIWCYFIHWCMVTPKQTQTVNVSKHKPESIIIVFYGKVWTTVSWHFSCCCLLDFLYCKEIVEPDCRLFCVLVVLFCFFALCHTCLCSFYEICRT